MLLCWGELDPVFDKDFLCSGRGAFPERSSRSSPVEDIIFWRMLMKLSCLSCENSWKLL